MVAARPSFLSLLIVLHLLSTADAADESIDFVRDVRPIFLKHCNSCHGAEKQKSGLRLDIKSEAFKGGELYGASLVAGKPQESPLWQFVADKNADLVMPPEGDGLSSAEVATLTRWINEGANWPDGVDLAKLEDRRDHWSFHPVKPISPPKVQGVTWTRNAIDQFILSRLEQEQLQPASEASRIVWLRRVTFDLTGLPPTPEEVAEFNNDDSEAAYERVVDRLLQSPRYGERWAQHWLDVVRFADTHGFEVNTERPNAWPYRDYVIRALNDDVSYGQFIREQLAGDVYQEDAATGFLVTASVLLPGQIGQDEPSKRLARQDSLDEIVVNISQTFLGLSIGCARCHDHKFDPVSQQEYYEMQSFVAGVEYGDRELRGVDDQQRKEKAAKLRQQIGALDRQLAEFVPLAGSGVTRPMVNARDNIDRFAPVTTRKVRFTILATNSLEPCIDELEVFNQNGENVALASAHAVVRSSGNRVDPNRHELRFVNNGQYGNTSSWMSSEYGAGWLEVEFAETQRVDRVRWGRDRNGQYSDRLAIDYRIEYEDPEGAWTSVADASDRKPFDANVKNAESFTTDGLTAEQTAEVTKLQASRTQLLNELKTAETLPQVFAGKFRTPDEIRMLTRGDPEQPKDRVAPAVPDVLGTLELPLDAPEQQRRQALADWIASPENPLTARVMVNRIWQGHFGIGLVETASDFGRSGMAPSHPELLDWLATEFVNSGWSLKAMHKRIVLSATYRQASRQSNEGLQQHAEAFDADVRLLWRYPGRRLEGEAIRDSMLATSGQLNLEMYGRGYDLFDKRGGLSGFNPVEHFQGAGLRRMVYAHKVRRERDAVFGAFDCPDAGQSTSRRRESTTPIQALNLFNSQFTLDQSNAFAERITKESGDDISSQVQRAWELALSRSPTEDELQEAGPLVQSHGLATLCRVLFNSNEFLFVP